MSLIIDVFFELLGLPCGGSWRSAWSLLCVAPGLGDFASPKHRAEP